MRRIVAKPAVLAAIGVLLVCVAPASAQQAARLTTGGDPISMPGITRVLGAFVLVAGLAVGVALALRRFAPRLGGGSLFSGTNLRVLERLNLGGDLRVHLVQTEQGRVLITAHRNSISVVVLDAPVQGTQQP